MSVKILLSLSLVLGFYLGVQVGGPWWSETFFSSARTYQLVTPPIESRRCQLQEQFSCVREMTFDPGGRVLVVSGSTGVSGRYRVEEGWLHLSLKSDAGDEKIRLRLNPDQSQVTLLEAPSSAVWQLAETSNSSI